MKHKVGIWIDHRKAVIVTFEGKHEQVTVVESDVEKHVRTAGGSRSASPYGPQEIVSEGRVARKFTQYCEKFYSEVESLLPPACAIYICGPGEAKLEFNKHLARNKNLAEHIRDIEPADELTETQIVACVKEYFQIA
ncbi:MAG TPA: hypothetical protein PLB18_18315 [Acidobacteriota bacterium]|nr:hypothetical protein [Acidobacteriota bacterium]